ncbi:MAG: YncE family protein [Candidatus Methylomirabilia bacterium]
MRLLLVVLALGSALVTLAGQRVTAGTLYVTNRGSGTLAILDDSTLRVREVIPVGERVWGVAVAPDRTAACVSYSAGVAVVNLKTGSVEHHVALGGQGMGVAMSLDGMLCYVAVHRLDEDGLVAVDRRSGQIRGQVPIGKRAFGVYLSPDGQSLYVPEHDAFSLSVIDAASLTTRRRLPLRPLGEGAFEKPHYLAMSSDGTRLYLPFQGRALVVIDIPAWTVAVHPLDIHAHQHGLAISRDGGRLYLANNVFGGEGSLSEVDTKTFQELRRIPLSEHHEQVVLNSITRRVYLTGGFALGGHDELTVVELETGSVTQVGTGGKRPFAILRLP